MIFPSDIERLLAEDIGGGDVTTEALGIGDLPARITFTARHPMTLAGSDIAAAMAGTLCLERHASDGDRLAPGAPILDVEGTAAALHGIWKVAQTTMEILSGIASATREIVDAAARVDPEIRVATTRKTFPGVRRLSQLAVIAGGGILHRRGLGETVLVFAEHRRFLPGLSLADIGRRLRRAQPEKALGVEVATVEEAIEAAAAGFDVIQLEKFPPAEVSRLVAALPPRGTRPRLAAAGGIDPGNAADYVRAGADLLVTSWPYTARPRDISVRLEPLGG